MRTVYVQDDPPLPRYVVEVSPDCDERVCIVALYLHRKPEEILSTLIDLAVRSGDLDQLLPSQDE